MSGAIQCPHCGGWESEVVDSRPRKTPIPHMHRRRRCACGERYGTREFLDDVGFSGFIDANGIGKRDRAIVQGVVTLLRDQAT